MPKIKFSEIEKNPYIDVKSIKLEGTEISGLLVNSTNNDIYDVGITGLLYGEDDEKILDTTFDCILVIPAGNTWEFFLTLKENSTRFCIHSIEYEIEEDRLFY